MAILEKGKGKIAPEDLIQHLEPSVKIKSKQAISQKRPNPRFQTFWMKYDVDKLSQDIDMDTWYKPCLLYGYIAVSDYNVSGPNHGWLPFNRPNFGYSFLFDREWCDPVQVNNTNSIRSLLSPKTARSVSALSSVLEIVVDLYAHDEQKKELFWVAKDKMVVNLTKPENLDTFITSRFNGKDGCLDISFMVLSDAVDAYLDITFKKTASFVSQELFHIHIIAYYGSESDGPFPSENSPNCVTLFETYDAKLLEDFKFPIDSSLLAVPVYGSLVIRAYILGLSSSDMLLLDFCKLNAKKEGTTFQSIKGKNCSCEVNVTWKY